MLVGGERGDFVLRGVVLVLERGVYLHPRRVSLLALADKMLFLTLEQVFLYALGVAGMGLGDGVVGGGHGFVARVSFILSNNVSKAFFAASSGGSSFGWRRHSSILAFASSKDS